MKLVHIEDIEHATAERLVAQVLIAGEQSSVRIIRLAAGQALPPHRHGRSDLLLHVVDGVGELGPTGESVTFQRGALAYFRGDEEVQVRNTGQLEMTLLDFLAPWPTG